MALNGSNNDERRRELIDEFDKTKLGVKGLVDSGITRIPLIFHHPPESFIGESVEPDSDDVIPVIDFSDPDSDELVGRVREASAEYGFFQVVNHGIPLSVSDRVIAAFRAFHESPPEEKSPIYRRGGSAVGVEFYSNFELLHSKGASWRDSLDIRLGPNPPIVNPKDIPLVCREEVFEWDKEMENIGDRIMGLLSKGLGLSEDRLKGPEYIGRRTMVGHYYPPCPEPTKTMGIASHTDSINFFTVLLQDQVGGLQVNHRGRWLRLRPIHSALVVNIGDLLQIISNDAYKSVEHRVVANSSPIPRVSIPIFFSPGMNHNMYGPLPEMVSPEKPPLYRMFRRSDFLSRFFSNNLEAKSLIKFYRL